MDARQIYAALFDPRGSVGAPSGEWRYIGDGEILDESLLRTFLAGSISSPKAFIAISRHEAHHVRREALYGLALSLLSHGDVRIADSDLRHFVELSRLGVARTWRRDA